MDQQPVACARSRESLLDLLNNNPFIVELIEELTGADAAEVGRTLAREHESLGLAVAEELREWQVTPYVWSERMAQYYSQANGFLYETLVWNRTALKQEMRKWIDGFFEAEVGGPRRILVFGDGLGIDSLYFAEAGHVVDYYEVSQRCIRFARRLGEALGRQLSIVSAPEEVNAESYDAVICLDVLEHVPNPPELAGLLASYLRPGGRLVVHAPFWYIHPRVSTHLKSNVQYSGDLRRLYRAHGLRPIAANWFWNPLVLEKTPRGTAPTRNALSTRLKLAISGCLLKSARLCRLPHIWAVRSMIHQERRRLAKLSTGLANLPAGG